MAKMRVNADGPVAQFIVERADGHKLSLSSMGHGNLAECDGDWNFVKNYGDWNINPRKFMAILAEFLGDEE